MSAAGGLRWSLVATAAGVLVLLAGAARLLWVWVRDGVGAVDPEASVLGAVLAAAGSAVALIGWTARRRRDAALPATAEQAEAAAATLKGLVTEQWNREAQARGLGDPEPMPVRWRLTGTDLMDHPAVISPDAPLAFEESSARIGSLTAAFRALPRRRLVIIGGPGTGKTTLAVQLLRELLARPQPGDPVPVLFSLTSWDPERRPQVQEWLTEQLNETYPSLRAISPNAAAALAGRNLVLPVLDGLDEVATDRRAGIVAALNRHLDGVVLTSRRSEFRAAIEDTGQLLTAAAVIAPLALAPAEAAAYLGRSLPPRRPAAWDRALTDLAGGAAASLAAITATPLGLWLVRTVYLAGPVADRPDPGALTSAGFGTRQALLDHLLEQLIPAVIRVRPPLDRPRREDPDDSLRPARRHDPADVRRWLTTLAEELRDGGTPDWRWWRLAEHTFVTPGARLAERALIGLAGGLMFGLVALPVFVASEGPAAAAGGAVLFGVPGGLVLAVMSGSLFGPARARPEPVRGRTDRRWRTLTAAALAALAAGVLLGWAISLTFTEIFGWTVVLAVELLGGLPAAWPTGLGPGSAYGLTTGLAAGLAFALRNHVVSTVHRPAPSSPPAGRRQSIGRSAVAVLPFVLALLLTGANVDGFVAGLLAGLGVGILLGLVLGVEFGLLVVLPVVLVLVAVVAIVSGPWTALPFLLVFVLVLGLRTVLDRAAATEGFASRWLGFRSDVGRSMIVNFVFVLAAGTAFGLAQRPDLGVIFAVAFALTMGVGGLAAGMSAGLLLGLFVGLAVRFSAALGEGRAFEPWASLTFGLVFGLVFGLAFWLRTYVRRPALAAGSPSPRLGFRRALRRGVLADLLCVVVATPVLLLLGQLVPVSATLLMAGLSGVLAGGMAEAWFTFAVAAGWLRLRRRRLPVPWRVMAVLEDCYRLGLLRTVGPIYQFRHEQFQAHLAPVPTPVPAPAAAGAG